MSKSKSKLFLSNGLPHNCDGYPDFAKNFNFNPLLPTTTISHSAISYTLPPHQWHLWNYCLLRILCILYLMDGWMDGWSSHPQTGGSSVLGLLGLGRCSTSSCRLTGMAITRHTGNGTHLVSGSLLWVILFFVLASILLVTLLWICLSGLLWRQLQGR